MITSVPARIRIVLVDDHAMVRSGVRLLLGTQPGLDVVGEAGDSAGAVEVVERTQPDVILLDLLLKDETGLDLITPLSRAAPDAKILIVTATTDPNDHRTAVRRGARGVVVKDTAGDLLLKAVARVAAGEIWLDRSTMAGMLAEDERSTTQRTLEEAQIDSLTPREREVIPLVAEGLRNKAIADRLGISETTVRHHLSSIFSKLDVPDRMSLLVYAFRHKLAPAPKR